MVGKYIYSNQGKDWSEMHDAPLDPNIWIMGRTTHKRDEPCHYVALGDFIDRWGRDNMSLNLVAWRHLTIEERVRYKDVIKADRKQL